MHLLHQTSDEVHFVVSQASYPTYLQQRNGYTPLPPDGIALAKGICSREQGLGDEGKGLRDERMNQKKRGFCTHQKTIPGLDACFCCDCRKWFLVNTPEYNKIVKRHGGSKGKG